MTLRSIGKVVAIVILASFVAPALGGPVESLLSSMARDAKRRNCWPQPFVSPDRQSAREPFATMVSGGWELQNLLGDLYFDSEGNLTEAGRLRVQWIVNEAPEQHRVVYVHRAEDQRLTSLRMASVQKYAATAAQGQPLPQVVASNRVDNGSPAELVDAVAKKAIANAPNPTLSGSGGGGGGGGGGK